MSLQIALADACNSVIPRISAHSPESKQATINVKSTSPSSCHRRQIAVMPQKRLDGQGACRNSDAGKLSALDDTNDAGSRSFDGSNESKEEAEAPESLHQAAWDNPGTAAGDRPRTVCFLPSPLLIAAPNLTLFSQRPSFANPFTGDDASSRKCSDTSSYSSADDAHAFAGHRDTLARLYEVHRDEQNDIGARQNVRSSRCRIKSGTMHRDNLARLDASRTKTLPENVLESIAGYLDLNEYKNMRLAGRQWGEQLPAPRLNAAHRLPSELLTEIFYLLPLTDYDSARHSCRSWYRASLNDKIGRTKLKSSGGYSAFLRDLELERKRLEQAKSKSTNAEIAGRLRLDQVWLLSKRVATESRLSSNWRGSSMRPHSGHSHSSFTVIEIVDFRRLLSADQEGGVVDVPRRRFTVSSCGKYLLVNADKEIFVYSLCDPQSFLEPIVRLGATRRVLSVSMDTSSGRNVVAALSEGRLGQSWDLRQICASPNHFPLIGAPLNLGMRTDGLGLAPRGSNNPIPMQVLRKSTTNLDIPPDLEPFIDPDELVESAHGKVPGHTESPESTSPYLSAMHDQATDLQATLDARAALPSPIPIIPRPTTIFTNLGTDRDHPRSVAVCPQRKCVAFGCRSGIELHWLDRTTNTSLNRWLPLHAPSDHLYFLPERPGIDSSKKLRLISSAADPSRIPKPRHDSAPSQWKLMSTSPGYGRMQSMTRLFLGSWSFPSALSRRNSIAGNEDSHGVLRTVDCDHYRAVPISDGAHVLFTDPGTGLLCLGSDAPLGGPTKLIRKVCMVPPTTDEPEGANTLVCYQAGSDLSWGTRVVAAHEDGRVVLYSIPVDCFERMCYIRSSPDVWDEMAGVLGQSDLLMDAFMAEDEIQETSDASSDPCSETPRLSNGSTEPVSFRSLHIGGVEIYRSDCEIEDIQVDCATGGVKVSLFLHDGVAVRLSIYAPRNFKPLQRYVGADGLIHHANESPAQKTQMLFKSSGKIRTGSDDEDQMDGKHVKFAVCK